MLLINPCKKCKEYRKIIEEGLEMIYEGEFNSIGTTIAFIEKCLEKDLDKEIYSHISDICENCEPRKLPSIYNKSFYMDLKEKLERAEYETMDMEKDERIIYFAFLKFMKRLNDMEEKIEALEKQYK